MGELVDLAAERERRGAGAVGLVTKVEVAAHFRVSPRTVERWMRRGMPFHKPFEGGLVRFSLRACDEWSRTAFDTER